VKTKYGYRHYIALRFRFVLRGIFDPLFRFGEICRAIVTAVGFGEQIAALFGGRVCLASPR
jgi:hypothetical protein